MIEGLLGLLKPNQDPILFLSPKLRPFYETPSPMDEGREIFLSPQDLSRPITRRYLSDYCKIGGLTNNEIKELAKLEDTSHKLKRPMLIGDMGCGQGNAIKPFLGDSFVKAVGIDTAVQPNQRDNITILNGDFTDSTSPFWENKYDYLFCIATAQYLKMDINELIKLMRTGLSDRGKAIIVVPLRQEKINYHFDRNSLREKGLNVVLPTIDPIDQTQYAAIKFNRK